MRALYSLLGVAVVLWLVLTIAEMAENGGGRSRPARSTAALTPAVPPSSRPKGKGVMVETETGKTYRTP